MVYQCWVVYLSYIIYFTTGGGNDGARSLIEQFLRTLFVGALAFAYSNLCVYGFGIVLGFDLSIFAFTLCAMLAWLMLNCFGVELLILQQQLFVGGLVFVIGAATLCICQLHLPICTLYLVPALNYYVLSGWLTDEKQVKYFNDKIITSYTLSNGLIDLVETPYRKPILRSKNDLDRRIEDNNMDNKI